MYVLFSFDLQDLFPFIFVRFQFRHKNTKKNAHLQISRRKIAVYCIFLKGKRHMCSHECGAQPLKKVRA